MGGKSPARGCLESNAALMASEGPSQLVKNTIDHLKLASPVSIDRRTICAIGLHIDCKLIIEVCDTIRCELGAAPESEVAGTGRDGWIEVGLLLEWSLASPVCVEGAVGQHINVQKAGFVGEGIGAKPGRTGRIARFDKD